MSDEEREERELDLTSHEVLTKYKSAAEIVNKALQLVLSQCKPLARIVDLCEKGDAFIREQTGNIYKNVKIERGVALPTCISVNNTVCHFSPLASDNYKLMVGDMLKIDMGCHIDGFIAVVAHTHVIQQRPVTGRAADVIAAANTAAEVALRLVRPGKKNKDVTEAIQKVAPAYDCKIVVGLCHQRKQKVVPSTWVVNTKDAEIEFKENEVYTIDIVTSTGEGKPKLMDKKQTTKKRALNKNHHKASRSILSEISQNSQIMPSSDRALEEKRARLGLVECVNHDVLPPLLHEKPGDLVAHIKFTVLLMPNGSDRITSHPLQELQSTKAVEDPEIKAWLALATKTKKKGGGKKKKAKEEAILVAKEEALGEKEMECAAALWHVLDELMKYNEKVMLEDAGEEEEGVADGGGDESLEGITCAICLAPDHLIYNCPLERGTSSTTLPVVSSDYRVLCKRCGNTEFAMCDFKSFQACVKCGGCVLCAVRVRCPICLEYGHLSKKDIKCVLYGKEFTIKNDPLRNVYCAESP